MKLWLEDGSQKSSQYFLCDPITNHGNAERPKLFGTGTFRDVDSA